MNAEIEKSEDLLGYIDTALNLGVIFDDDSFVSKFNGNKIYACGLGLMLIGKCGLDEAVALYNTTRGVEMGWEDMHMWFAEKLDITYAQALDITSKSCSSLEAVKEYITTF